VTTLARPGDGRDIFAQTLSHLIGEERFRRYFGDRDAIRCEGERVRVLAGSDFQAEMLSRRFGDALQEAARADGRQRRVTVEVRPHDPEPARASFAAQAPAALPAELRRPRRAGFGRGRTLEDFVVGESNRLAHSAAVRLAEEGAGSALSPLFFHGACGTGKTHLLEGLARRVRERRPGARVRYTTGEAFTNQFVRAVRENSIAAFHAEHRKLDLLCVDDVHFLASKNATQAELLHTLNDLTISGAPIAMASDAHPSVITSFSRELVSRFMAGMVVQVEKPDQDLRRRLAASFAAKRGLMLDDEGAALVARHASNSVREIEGAVVRIEAVSRLIDGAAAGPTPLATIRRALELGSPARSSEPIRAERIIEASAERLGVEVSEVLGRSRHRRVVAARSIAALLARRHTTLSYPELAVKLNRPNHSSVVTACQRLSRQMDDGGTLAMAPGEPPTPLTDLVGLIESDLQR
jgi:chromosomal replication initiator protein